METNTKAANLAQEIETHRTFWAEVAQANGWYQTPFYVQVWADPDTLKVWDSVSTRGQLADFITYEAEPLTD